tara:strand:- start:82210 stop:85242 length:3033 start_codon:yes stop_codon:yes gene_type:complete
MKISNVILTISFLLFQSILFSQSNSTISGTVTDTGNQPLPGASIVLKGTTTGTQTDFDGNFILDKIPSNGILVVSYVGYTTKEVPISNQQQITISLQEDAQALDEVVVVGYGTQKKADLTGAITTIKSEDIEKTPNSNVMQSLQGKVAGLQVTSTGSPGDSPTVRIRGVSSYNNGGNTNPLYVVDGMFYDNIDFLDNSQIETVSVLKDASSVAIFGQKGVNGVIIIETKTGKLEQKPVFTYNGYTGYQVAQNVMKMANAEQFVTMANESGSDADIQFVQNAMQRYGRSRINPNVPNVNTDWYKEVLRVAPIISHSIGASGGGESVTYGVSTNYFSQDGILDMKNDYERFNIQSNVDIKLSERLKIGTNAIFSNANKYNAENGAWFQAYFAVPILPVYDELNIGATPIAFSDASRLGYRGSQNPFPVMRFNNNFLKIRKILASLNLEYSIIPDKLAFKTSYRHDYSTISERNVRLPYFISENSQRETSSIIRQEQTFSNQIWDNTITYKDSFEDHNLTLLAGTSYRDEQYNRFKATGNDIQGIGLESSWYLDFADPTSFSNQVEEIGDRFYALAYFGRLEYNYKSKYLLNATVRHEGDAKFPKEIWVTTPTVGMGWVISEENFMQDNEVFNFLKLRGSWGQLANGALGGSAGTRTVAQITTDIGDVATNGIISSSNFTNLEREILEETNVGISARMFQNKLSLEADYYIRDTKKLVIPVDQPIVSNTILENVGEMRNTGFEISANWSQLINDNWSFSLGGNVATLKNEVTKINSASGYFDTGSAEFRQRTMVGEPIEAFFGWEVVGVYQNDTEIQNDPIAVANNLVPGDFKYRDLDIDGDIDADDRVVLGSYLPSFNYGGNLQVSYKNFDFSIAVFGQTGNEILNRKRGEVLFTNDTNMDADLVINRWHGEGTSNTYTSSAGRRKLWNQKMSSFFIEDGSFFRIQNLQLGYRIPSGSLIGKNMPETKITFTAERPFTSFKYNGFNPEVADGIDRQTYPVPAIYTVGVNIKI